jgi:23S rRNA (pseudouridine1915-N3)-methyltransferase
MRALRLCETACAVARVRAGCAAMRRDALGDPRSLRRAACVSSSPAPRARHAAWVTRVPTRAMATGGNNMDTERRKANARAVRAVPIKLVLVTKGGGKDMDKACGEWSGRIARYTQFDEVPCKSNPKNAKEPKAQMEAEAERVMKQIDSRDLVVLMDERGKDVSSEELAELVAEAGDGGYGGLVFCIGGPFGHGDAVKTRADRKIKLSSMVMNHQVARLVLLEQIYRAWTILRGEPYHH